MDSVRPNPLPPDSPPLSAAPGPREIGLAKDQLLLRLFIWIVVAISAANLLSAGVSATGIEFSSGWRLVIDSVAAIAFLFLGLYWFVLRPMLRQGRRLEEDVEQLLKVSQELTRSLATAELQIASLKAQLETAAAARRAREEEIQRLNQELERRVLDRTAQFEVLNRELQRELGDQRKSIEALRESEKRFRRLVEVAQHGVWTINAQGKTNFINPHAGQLLGYTVPEMLGRPPSDFAVADDLPPEARGFDLQRTGALRSVEFRMRHKEGHELWVHASLTPLQGDQGEYLGALVVFEDWTKRKGTEQRLQERAILLESAPDAFILCDDHFHILSWNQGAERLSGWANDEVLGREIFDLLSPAPGSLMREPIAQFLNQHDRWRGELEFKTKAGQLLVVDARVNKTAAAPGKPRSNLLVMTDITASKREQAQRMRTQRMETASGLASGVAQELNTALSPVLISIQMLRGKSLDREGQELITTIESSTERSIELLRQLLIFARGIDGERVVMEPARLLKDIAGVAREMFPRNIQVLCEAASPTWNLKGDPAQLHQLFLKLCVRSRDAMPHGGVLWLRAKNIQLERDSDGLKAGPYVRFEVQDNGTGLAPEARERIFEPFASTTSSAKGGGLGLAIALGIVKSHRGSIAVQSETATGTTFEILLPAATDVTPQLPPRLNVPAPGRGELILLVEDEPALRDVTSRTLTQHGYQVVATSDGVEALGLLAQQQGRVRLVLTNMVTPSMDGTALAQAARQIDPRVRVIASSGLGRSYGQAEKLAALQSLGISRMLPKPYRTEELLGAIRDELSSG
jgi:two-component system cell cycle sensor histidine kinase/response regulator CckA